MRTAVRFAAAVLAGAMALAGCAITPPRLGDTSPVASPTVVTTDPPGVPMVAVLVYHPRESNNGLRLGRELRQVPQADPLRGALEVMIQGPIDPDYRSGWSHETRVLSVTTSGDVTTVDLSADALRSSKFGSGRALAAIDQLVWTVTEQTGADSLVALTIEGEPPGELWGVTRWDTPRGREDPLGVRVHVSIDAPAEGEVLRSPVKIAGESAFADGSVLWVVRDGAGATIAEGRETLTGSTPFAPYTVEVDLLPGTYEIEVTGDAIGDGEGYRPDTDTRTFVVEA